MKKNRIHYLLFLGLISFGVIFMIGNAKVDAVSPTPTPVSPIPVATSPAPKSTATPSPTSTPVTSGPSLPLPTTQYLPQITIEDMVDKVVRIVFAVGEIAFVLVLLIGGVIYITSMGDDAKAEKAKKLMLNAVIGIVIVFGAWALARFIINILK